jgi:preprotein translocase subunit SecD
MYIRDGMNAIRCLIFAAIACIVACDSSKESIVSAQLAQGDVADITSAVAILGKRLALVTGVDEKSIRPVVSGTTVRYTVVVPPSSEARLKAVLMAKGEFKIAPTDGVGEPWLSDEDVAYADAFCNGDSCYVRVTAKPAAARRLTDLTTANVGREIAMSWNGQPVVTAPVLGPFGEEPVQFGPLSQEDAKVAALVLRTGRLPLSVLDATIDSAPK